ncbi:MAG: 50S ribosomal protein L10 [Candidatus Dasytiphilus stammeri]
MAINLEKKQEIISKISNIAKHSLSVVIADSSGIQANKMTELRKLTRESNVDMYVARNTLLRIIVRETKFQCIMESLRGPCLIAFSKVHPGTAARLFNNFAKTNSKFIVKAASYEGKILTAEQIEVLASLPTYEEAVRRLIIALQEISSGRLVRSLSNYCKSKHTR